MECLQNEVLVRFERSWIDSKVLASSWLSETVLSRASMRVSHLTDGCLNRRAACCREREGSTVHVENAHGALAVFWLLFSISLSCFYSLGVQRSGNLGCC